MKQHNWNPFRLKDSLKDSRVIFKIAQEYFGTPIQSEQLCNVWDTAPTYRYAWKLHEHGLIYNLSITHLDGHNFIEIVYDVEFANIIVDDLTNIIVDDIQYLKNKNNWGDILDNFVSKVKKPWVEFTFDEMAQNVSFIYFYFLEEGTVSDDLHQVMVLKSYKEPENKYIKKYFDAIQKETKV